MSRVTLVALVTLLTAGTTSAALACCGAPVYAPVPVYYAPTVCGGCAPAVAYLPAVAAAPVACGGCASPVVYVAPPVELTPVAPAPIYVVNQGPEFSGPGIIVPYHTYAPAAAWAPAVNYPYIRWHHGYRYHAPGPRFAYHAHGFLRPVHYGPAWRWRHYPHRPLDVRG